MIAGLILIPLVAAGAAFAIRSHPVRRAMLVSVAAVHAALTARLWVDWPARPAPVLDGWLAVDAPGLLFLSTCSALFLAAAVYAVGYHAREDVGEPRRDIEEGGLFFRNEPEAVFAGCMLLFLGSMTGVSLSQHLGLLWVGVEATTLATAPLIYYHRHHRSLEATWKYLLICSVGLALAMIGNFALAASIPRAEAESGRINLVLGDLLANARALNPAWAQIAFVFFLVGYGTKMGLAPLHTWLPDAHSEAPSLVSALMSGALLNCAFLGVLRGHQVCTAAGFPGFSSELLIWFGLLSMAVAAVFILGQTDFKRMLAYSSVEHMGILALAVGCGAAYGMGLHALGHSLIKGSLFLTSGILLAAYQTKNVTKIHNLLADYPVTGLLWLAGFLAITGAPPFSLFLSEFTVGKTLLDADRPVAAAAYLVLLGVIFLGMASAVLPMVHGTGPVDHEPAGGQSAPPGYRPPLTMLVPPIVLAGAVLGLGLYLPVDVREVLRDAAAALSGGVSP
ncbi:MAG: putative hydrogenase-4 component [Gemmataceae bacterium]|nr:putative hydrogenase-4 component [Gemmataceae bacterium]